LTSVIGKVAQGEVSNFSGAMMGAVAMVVPTPAAIADSSHLSRRPNQFRLEIFSIKSAQHPGQGEAPQEPGLSHYPAF
jgi:hypothetical protein